MTIVTARSSRSAYSQIRGEMSAEADAKIAEMIGSRGLDFGPTINREANRTGKAAEAMGGAYKVENQCRFAFN